MAFKPDLIDCSSVSYAAAPVCAAVARRFHAAFVITWHEFWGQDWFDYLPRGLATAARTVERVLPRLAHANVAVSRFTADRLRHASGGFAHVIPNGIDLRSIDKARPSSRARDVVFVGRLIREKRVPLLLEAIRAIAPSVPKLHVELIGDGPEKASIQALAQALPANVRVDLTSHVDEVTELYSRIKSAKMLVLPSAREGYGLVVAEAQACGTVPIVVRGASNASVDLVEPGKTGIVTHPHAMHLAEAIGTLLSDTRLRNTMGQQARFASEARDWDRSAASTAGLYRTLRAKPARQHIPRGSVIRRGTGWRPSDG